MLSSMSVTCAAAARSVSVEQAPGGEGLGCAVQPPRLHSPKRDAPLRPHAASMMRFPPRAPGGPCARACDAKQPHAPRGCSRRIARAQRQPGHAAHRSTAPRRGWHAPAPCGRAGCGLRALGMPLPGVPIALTTTIFCCTAMSIISFAAFLMRSGEPTQVPPNLGRRAKRRVSRTEMADQGWHAGVCAALRGRAARAAAGARTCEPPTTCREGKRLRQRPWAPPPWRTRQAQPTGLRRAWRRRTRGGARRAAEPCRPRCRRRDERSAARAAPAAAVPHLVQQHAGNRRPPATRRRRACCCTGGAAAAPASAHAETRTGEVVATEVAPPAPSADVAWLQSGAALPEPWPWRAGVRSALAWPPPWRARC